MMAISVPWIFKNLRRCPKTSTCGQPKLWTRSPMKSSSCRPGGDGFLGQSEVGAPRCVPA